MSTLIKVHPLTRVCTIYHKDSAILSLILYLMWDLLELSQSQCRCLHLTKEFLLLKISKIKALKILIITIITLKEKIFIKKVLIFNKKIKALIIQTIKRKIMLMILKLLTHIKVKFKIQVK